MRPKTIALGILALAIVATATISGIAFAAPTGVFAPGYIISDAQFFNAQSMSQSDVQNFLAGQKCTPTGGVACPANYSAVTVNEAAAYCSAYSGGGSESASAIIWKVSQACGINPKVLLVLVQKEESLITNPSPGGYNFAAGWDCPDSAGCSPGASGFFTQIFGAAQQFRIYTTNSSHFRYHIGSNSIQYSPTASCGSSTVNIQNQATANLYNYTPYQPDAAALSNLYGTGDSCSSYGNRNFWRTYSDWFGSPTNSSPIGQVENIQQIPGGIGIWGWALDTDTTNSLEVDVYVDGQMVTGASANVARPDILADYNFGANHGFSITVPAAAGSHSVCVYAINVGAGSNTQFGCWNISVAANPIGQVENIQPQLGGYGIWGWALDPDTADPVTIAYYLDGHMVLGAEASVSRTDVGLAHPGYGDDHGFGEFIPASGGVHSLCAYALNMGAGTVNTSLGCHTVTTGGSPIGAVDPVTTLTHTINATGWVIDPDTLDPIQISVYLDGAIVQQAIANGTRTAPGAYASYGTNHGFSVQVPTTAGAHSLCIYGLNVDSGTNTQLQCKSVQVGGSPIGAVENGQPGFGSIGVWGWALDPDTTDPVLMNYYVDGHMVLGSGAAVARPDIGVAHPGYGDNHGFGVSLSATPGTHQVCSYAINVGYGQNTKLACFTTTVSGNPTGTIDNVQSELDPAGSGKTGMGVWGFAIDPDTANPIAVHAYLDGTIVGVFSANVTRSDLAVSYPGYGTNHAYGFWIPAAPGVHNLCVYAINTGSGSNTELPCITLTSH